MLKLTMMLQGFSKRILVRFTNWVEFVMWGCVLQQGLKAASEEAGVPVAWGPLDDRAGRKFGKWILGWLKILGWDVADRRR